MQVRELMTTDFHLVAPDASVQEAARLMRDLDVGMIPVGDGRQLVGTVTDRDIAVRAVAEGRDPAVTAVKHIMSGDIVYCYDDDDVDGAARAMEARRIRRLVVVNHENQPVGIVALADIAINPHVREVAGEVLEEVSQPDSQP
ncbi:MAG TPA: CBS domain-containing protein [Gammaproteobacteria bacterium]|nr:CBS domain-containing protein [Gammaproteobacteria bacterium]